MLANIQAFHSSTCRLNHVSFTSQRPKTATKHNVLDGNSSTTAKAFVIRY
jgi:hypothetical protein